MRSRPVKAALALALATRPRRCPRRALRRIGVVKLQLHVAAVHKRFAKYGTEEHIGVADAHFPHLHPRGSHDVQAVVEGENDAFLGHPQQVGRAVHIEVEAAQLGVGQAVFEDALDAVAKGQEQQAPGPDGGLSGQPVHLVVGQVAHDFAQPAVQNAGAIQALQHAVAGVRGGCC